MLVPYASYYLPVFNVCLRVTHRSGGVLLARSRTGNGNGASRKVDKTSRFFFFFFFFFFFLLLLLLLLLLLFFFFFFFLLSFARPNATNRCSTASEIPCALHQSGCNCKLKSHVRAECAR